MRPAHALRALSILAAAGGIFAGHAAGQVVVSQVDGNGGLTVVGTSPFDRDFIELFNKGSTPVNLNGWSLQIAPDNGSLASPGTLSWTGVPLSGTIYPGQYFLVLHSLQRGSQGASVTTAVLPPADVVGTIYAQATLVSAANAVALMSSTAPVAPGDCPVGRADFVDLLRYGHPNGQCFEGTPTAGPTAGQAAVFRADSGCTDTNNSAADLVLGQVPEPRNSDTNVFVSTPVSPASVITGTGGLVTITAVRGPASCNPISVPLTAATANLSAFGLSAAAPLFDDGAHGDGGSGDGTFGVQFTVSAAIPAGTYVVPVSATGGATTLTVGANVRVSPVPATNDFCADAIDLSDPAPGGINIITGGTYSTLVNTSGATSDGIDAGSCNGDAEVKYSVWYKFTAATSGAVRMSETGSEDVVYSIHAACGAASSICLGREDAGFPVLAGSTYFIQIGRETGAPSVPLVPLQLSFSFVAPPVNDTPCTATVVSSFPLVAQPYAPSASDETNPLVNITCDVAANPAARSGVWYTFTPAVSSVLQIFENSINPSNFAIFTGPCESPTTVTCIDETTSGAIIAGLAAGTQYWLLVSYDAAVTTSTANQPYDFTINLLPTPSNDLCSGATNLNTAGLPFMDTVNGRLASTDPNAPSSTGTGSVYNSCNTTFVTRNAGIWYVYTAGPTQTGSLRVAEHTTQDVFYNVFSGPCEALTPVQCYGAFTADDIFVQLSPNATYYILVSLASTSAGALPSADYELSFAYYPVPSNDLACDATFINTPTFNDIVAAPAATPDVDTSCNYNATPAQTSTGYGVWYRFLPTTAKQLRVSEDNVETHTYALFTGPDCSSLTEVGCSTGSNGAVTVDNYMYFNLSANTEYWLLIGRAANNQPFGFYDLNFALTDPLGACCTSSGCSITTQAACTGSFAGPFSYCGKTPQYADNIANAIPDGTTTGAIPGVLTRTITVADSGTVADLKVLLEMNHARVGDLIITLQSPAGTTRELLRRIDDDDNLTCPNFGGQGRLSDLGGVYIFDDQAYTPLGPAFHAAAKYFDPVPSGHYRASTCDALDISFSDGFIGQSVAGDWTLTISDNQQSSTGTLIRWGLIVNGGATPPCPSSVFCCRGTTCNSVPAGTCTGTVAGGNSLVTSACGAGNALASCCHADFNHDGTPSIDDLFLYLNAYFTSSPWANVGGDGVATPVIDDLFLFINAYFTGCQ